MKGDAAANMLKVRSTRFEVEEVLIQIFNF
jgi:hypothetical protein